MRNSLSLPEEVGEHQWFALEVKCRHERFIAEGLQRKQYEAFAPRARIREQHQQKVQETDTVLFPGYVFARFDVRFRLPILMTPGVRGVVSYGRVPAPLSAAEISALTNILHCQLPLEPCPYLTEGDRVRIDKGALAGLEGVLVQVRSSYRVVLSVPLIHRSIRVEVDRDMLRLGNDSQSERVSRAS